MAAVPPLKRYLRGLAYWAAGDYLAVAFGGTGATAAGAARTNLGAAASGTNADITSLGAMTVPVSGFRNRLINPGFRISQRFPTSTSLDLSASAGLYGHDRWRGGATGLKYTVAVAPGGNDAAATITAGTMVQVIEATAFGTYEGGNWVLSWGGTAAARISYTNQSGNAVTTAYTGSPIALTNVAANYAVTIEWAQGTLAMPQFEPGIVPTPVERRPYAVELLLCYRYFRAFPYRISPYFDAQTGSTYQYLYFQNDCDFRVVPSVAGYADDQGTANQVIYLGSGNSVLSRGAAYSQLTDIRGGALTAYTVSRCAHGGSLSLDAEFH